MNQLVYTSNIESIVQVLEFCSFVFPKFPLDKSSEYFGVRKYLNKNFTESNSENELVLFRFADRVHDYEIYNSEDEIILSPLAYDKFMQLTSRLIQDLGQLYTKHGIEKSEDYSDRLLSYIKKRRDKKQFIDDDTLSWTNDASLVKSSIFEALSMFGELQKGYFELHSDKQNRIVLIMKAIN